MFQKPIPQRPLPFLLTLLTLCSCVRFHPQPIDPALNVAQFENRSLENPELKKFLEENLNQEISSWPLESWDFPHLVLAAFYFHPDLDVARAKWAVAKAGKITAGERPNPTVGFSPAYNTSVPPPWILGFNFDIPLETAGKRGYRIAQAKNLSQAAQWNIATAAWNIRSRLRKNLLALSAATERQALLKIQETIQTNNVRLLEEQQKAGAISQFVLTQSRLAMNTARLALRDVETQLALAKVDVASAIGLPLSALNNVKLSLEGITFLPAEISYDEIRRKALLNRADILSALAEYAALESSLRLEIAKQYPDIHLSPNYQLDQTDNKWGLGISATLPVFNHNRGAIAEAAARRQEAAARFNALQAAVIGGIDRAFAGYQSIREKNSTADLLWQNQSKLANSSKAMLEAGEISKQENALAELELNTAKLNRLAAAIEARDALGALEDAVQRPINSTGE